VKRVAAFVSTVLLSATATVLLMGVPTLGTAEEQPLTLSASVRLTDLDLSSETGLRAARDRIRYVAEQLCNELGEPPSRGVYDFADCVSFASSEPLRRLGTLANPNSGRAVADAGAH
jgi:UrcA family protein